MCRWLAYSGAPLPLEELILKPEHSRSIDALKEINPALERFSSDTRVVVSEPLSSMTEAWEEVPESSVVLVQHGAVEPSSFEPRV